MYLETNRPWVLAAAVAALAVAIGSIAIADEPKVEYKRVVVTTGDGDAKVMVWESDGDGDDIDVSGRSWLGLGLREETKLSEGGARVTTVIEGSPADKAGIKQGDVIVGFQGDVIRGPAKLTERIHETKPGQSVSLEVVRDGSRRTVTAEIGERKSVVRIFGPGMSGESLTDEQKRALELEHKALEQSLRGLGGETVIHLDGTALELDHKAVEESLRGLQEKMPELQRKLADLDRLRAPRAFAFSGPGRFFADMGGPKLGVELVEATPELREHLGGKPDAGVLVGKVLPGSAAEKSGLKVGDLIVRAAEAAIEDAGDLVEAVRDHAGKTVNLEVIRDGRSTTIKAAIPEPASDDAPRGPRAAVWVAPAPPAPPAPPARPAAPAPPAPATSTIL